MSEGIESGPGSEPEINPSTSSAGVAGPTQSEPAVLPPETGARVREPRLELSPWPTGERREKARAEPEERYRLFSDPVGLVAALATLGFLAIGGVVAHDHFAQTATVDGRAAETSKLAQRVDMLKAQVEAVDAARAHETTAEMRKLLGEIKADAAATRDFGAQLQQLGQRIDRLDHEDGQRLDRLTDRVEHDLATRMNDLSARVEKLEKHSASAFTGPTATSAPPPPPRPNAPPLPANVSNDITGSIGKPKATLHKYTLEDIRDGMALVDGPSGAFTVGPGDLIPGAGRVIRIERRGRDWAVITDAGIISAPED